MDDAIHCFRYYAGILKAPCGGSYEVNDGFGAMHSYTIHEPVGVCALITPMELSAADGSLEAGAGSGRGQQRGLQTQLKLCAVLCETV